MMDNETWAIRCLEVATAELARQKGSGFPAWVKRVSWAASGIYLGMTRAAIKEARHEPSFSLSGF